MEKVTYEVSENRLVTRWIANDGSEFLTPFQCQNYEDRLYLMNAKKIWTNVGEDFFREHFYLVDSQETLDVLVRHLLGGRKTTGFGDEICIGDWVTCNYKYNSNGSDEYFIITLKELNEAVKELNLFAKENK